MIKAEELRIGNWIIGAYPFQIAEIKKGANYNIYTPIPLTPEVLEMCGFEKMYSTVFSRNVSKERCSFTELRLDYYDDIGYYVDAIQERDDEEYDDIIKISTIKYLHQLQNIFFALTGEELQVNINNKITV